MYGLVVLLHVLGAFLFVLAHGVSMLVSFRLRGERDPVRQVVLFEPVVARMKPPPSPEDLDRLATSNRPIVLAAVGGIGLVVIIWLMLAKPF